MLTGSSSSVIKNAAKRFSEGENISKLKYSSASLYETNIEKNELDIQNAINEFINTEQHHLGNLKILKNHFYDQIKEKNFFDKSQMKLLFPNLDDILKFHCKSY